MTFLYSIPTLLVRSITWLFSEAFCLVSADRVSNTSGHHPCQRIPFASGEAVLDEFDGDANENGDD